VNLLLLSMLAGLPGLSPPGLQAATASTATASSLSAPLVWIEGRTPAPAPRAPEVLTPAAGRPVEIWRDRDGFFYLDGKINGRPVRFLIDTGASMIVLTARDARNVGAQGEASAANLEVGTANGKSAMARVTLDSVEIAGSGSANVPAAVAGDGLEVSLLGLSFISHIASMTIQGDRLLLHVD
jgi:aspartyl protease family protein